MKHVTLNWNLDQEENISGTGEDTGIWFEAILQYHANSDLLTLVLHWWYGKILIFGEDAEGMHRNLWHWFCHVFYEKFKGN